MHEYFYPFCLIIGFNSPGKEEIMRNYKDGIHRPLDMIEKPGRDNEDLQGWDLSSSRYD